MSDDSAPQWELLPGNPAAFFGLSRGFDLRALKSSYGVLIRKYKPETAPEEFQRIRAAFESLKDRLQSGDNFSGSPFSLPGFSVPDVLEPDRKVNERSRRQEPPGSSNRDEKGSSTPDEKIPRQEESAQERYESLVSQQKKSA